MPKWYRRRRTRRSARNDSAVPLLALLVVAILLLLVVNGKDLDIPMPRLNLPPLPNITIPITGLPEIRVPDVELPVTLSPGTLVPKIGIEGTEVPENGTSLRERSKSSGCLIQGSLPDPACTPGSVLSRNTDQVCTPGYAASVRDVSQSLKDEVYASYGIIPGSGDYQIDHLIPLSLGGSNDISNLWPSPAAPVPGYNEKDRVESYLHEQVCSGKQPLQQAQERIATNWVGVYLSMPK